MNTTACERAGLTSTPLFLGANRDLLQDLGSGVASALAGIVHRPFNECIGKITANWVAVFGFSAVWGTDRCSFLGTNGAGRPPSLRTRLKEVAIGQEPQPPRGFGYLKNAGHLIPPFHVKVQAGHMALTTASRPERPKAEGVVPVPCNLGGAT